MGTWNSRGLRGSTLEEMINRTNEKYREKGLALIQKIPTPITPIKIDKTHHQITLAYFDQKSTVDYIGAVQGIPVCFDAKECDVKTFPLQNVHEHQVKFMEDFEKRAGKAFCSFTIRQSKSFIIFISASCSFSGTGQKRADGRAFGWKNWIRFTFLTQIRAIWCLIWNL